MPKNFVDIPDVYPGVVRPVLYSAAQFLLEQLRLPEETTIYIPGEETTTPMNGSSFNCCRDAIRFPSESRLELRFTEEPVLETTLTTATNAHDNNPLFYDTVRGISVRPVHKMVRVNCEIVYVGQSRGVVQRMCDYVATRISSMMGEYTLQLKYHYTLPDVLVLLLMTLHKTMETSETPLNQSFGHYFELHRAHPMLNIGTMIGTAPRIAVSEIQEEVLGWFDFTDNPGKPERVSDSGDAWQISMNFGFNYVRPIQLFVEWPLLVHNKLIPKEWRTDSHYHSFYERTRKVSTLKEALDTLKFNELKYLPPSISVPEIDDWVAPVGENRYNFFFTALLQLTKANRHELIDLNNMGRWHFGEHLTQFLLDVGGCAIKAGGLLRAELYRNNKLINVELDIVDGKIITTEDLDLRYSYHIRFGLIRNLRFLHDPILACLRRYPHLFHQIVRYLRLPSAQIPYSELPLIGVGSSVTNEATCIGEKTEHRKSAGVVKTDYVDQVSKESNIKEIVNNRATSQRTMLTVMQLGIITLRKRK